jgi:Ca2+-binding RTX toxin-like protein
MNLTATELLTYLTTSLSEPETGVPLGSNIDLSQFAFERWDTAASINVADSASLLPSEEWLDVSDFTISKTFISEEKSSLLFSQSKKTNGDTVTATTNVRFTSANKDLLNLSFSKVLSPGSDPFEKNSTGGFASGDMQTDTVSLNYNFVGDKLTKEDDITYTIAINQKEIDGTGPSAGIYTERGSGSVRFLNNSYQFEVKGNFVEVINPQLNKSFSEDTYANYNFTDIPGKISLKYSNAKISKDYTKDSTRIQVQNAISQTADYRVEAAAVSQNIPISSDFVPDVLRENMELSSTDAIFESEPFILRGANRLTILNRDGYLLDASDGADVITGNTGPDTMVGGLGRDTLNGGAGDDVYVLNSFAGPDTVSDSGGANDAISWYEGRYGFNGIDMYRVRNNLIIRDTSGNQSTILNHATTGRIESFRVYTGDEASDIIEFTLSQGLNGTDANDWIAGTQGNDSLLGGGFGDDVLQGDNGNDTLSGGDGNDLIVGGFGSDQLGLTTASTVAGDAPEVEPGNDVFIFWDSPLGMGRDTINAGTGYDVLEWRGGFDASSMLPPSYENGGAMIYRTPTTIVGFSGQDYVFKGVKAPPSLISTVQNSPTSSLEAFRYIDQKWQLIDEIPLNMTASGSDGREMIVGSVPRNTTATPATPAAPTAANAWYSAVNDTLMAFGGDDVILPGAGRDSVDAGSGDDTIFSDDDYSIATADGLQNGIALLRGFEKDTLTGGGGNDFYAINGAGPTPQNIENTDWDQVNELEFDGWDDTIRANFVGQGLAGYDLHSRAPFVENLILGAGLDRGYGSGRDNELIGNSLNNLIDGRSGNDTLKGGEGNDQLIGGDGDDQLFGDAGWDRFEGGSGNDAYFVDSLDELRNITDSGGFDTVFLPDWLRSNSVLLPSGIEKIVWSSDQSRNIQGNDSDNQLSGGKGNDYIEGQEGEDTLSGGVGNDSLNGGVDRDQLYGGDGDDDLVGGAGDDYLDGGQGSDTMEGGIGDDYYAADWKDQIIESPSQGTDTIKLSIDDNPESSIDLSAPGRIALENIELTGNRDFDIDGNVLSNRLTGNSGDNSLTGGAGNDRLIPGGGDDTLDGGAGNDAYELFRYYDDSRQYAQISSVEIHESSGWDEIFANFYWSGDENLVDDDSSALLMNYLRGIKVTRYGSDLHLSSQLNSQEVTITDQFADTENTVMEKFVIQSKLQTINSWIDEDNFTAYEFIADNELDELEEGYNPRDWTGLFVVADENGRVLDGGDFSDIIHGGPGDDLINGGGGQNFLYGGDGNDVFVFDIGDHNDSYTWSDFLLNFNEAIPGLDARQGLESIGAVLEDANAIFDLQYTPTKTGQAIQDEIRLVLPSDGDRSLRDLTELVHQSGSDGISLGELVRNKDLDRFSPNTGVVYFQDADNTFSINLVDPYRAGTPKVIYFDDKVGEAEEDEDAALVVFTDDILNEWSIKLVAPEVNTDMSLVQLGMSDDITGSIDNDYLSGYLSNDTLSGADGNDYLNGGGDQDQLYGGNGNDQLIGGIGDDDLDGGEGDDYLYGNEGQDLLYGHLGNDSLVGGDGEDTLIGGDDQDTLEGGIGSDNLSGSLGADVYKFTQTEESSWWSGRDEININEDTSDRIQITLPSFGFDSITELSVSINEGGVRGMDRDELNALFSTQFGTASRTFLGMDDISALLVRDWQTPSGARLIVDSNGNGLLDGYELDVYVLGVETINPYELISFDFA